MARTADDVVRLPGGHRLPPQDLEAEQSVLGSMMLSGDAMSDVVEILEPDDFYRSANAKIFGILRTLFAHGEPVDVITSVDALRKAGVLDEVGRPPVPAGPRRPGPDAGRRGPLREDRRRRRAPAAA